jgi:tetrapyrrole methylase family protein/MazG family protein
VGNHSRYADFQEPSQAGATERETCYRSYGHMPRQSKRKRSGRHKSAPRDKASPTPPPRVGSAFDQLVGVMARLRAPGGCPWDREQTHDTLRTYLIEEAYEVLDALDSADDAKFAEELGDLLLQVLFHAQIAREESRFTIADVIREIYEKMIRRHPHVFGEKRAKTAAEVLRNWEIIKQQERQSKSASSDTPGRAPNLKNATDSIDSESKPASVLDGVPRTLPALLEALQLTRKAARIGFDWNSIDGIFDKLDEETHELRTVLSHSDKIPARIEGELGDILFVAVNLARFLDIDPEIALKKTSAKFSRRFHEMERIVRSQGTTLAKTPRPEMESLWDRAKLVEQSKS